MADPAQTATEGEPGHDGPIERCHRAFLAKFDTPGSDFDVNVVRVIVSIFFIWKLLSRDFGFYGQVPEEVLRFYPINIYPADSYILLTGLPVISELATFHWIHWILPRPNADTLRLIQGVAVVLLAAHAVLGRGPWRCVTIGSYAVLIYLWGHLFLAGHEVDAILLYFGLLLVLAIAEYDDRPLSALRHLTRRPANRAAGRAISMLFLVLVTYYFASGVNKLTDISPLDWFNYDLVETMEVARIRSDNGPILVPDVFEHLFGVTAINLIGPPLIYLSHLLVPVVFFRRHHVYKFFLFYAVFHFLAFGVGISFTGYIFVWFVLFPYRRLIFRRVGGEAA